MEIKTVSVIGANGSMGKLISGVVAAFGNCKVYMIARNVEDAIRAKEEAILSVKADSISNNLLPIGYDNIEEAFSNSDWIFESVFEDLNTKKSVSNLINLYAKKERLLLLELQDYLLTH